MVTAAWVETELSTGQPRGDAEKELDTGLRNWGVRTELQLGIWESSVGRYGFKPCDHLG